MKTNVSITYETKEYPEFTLDQVRQMVEYIKTGLTEEEARERVLQDTPTQ